MSDLQLSVSYSGVLMGDLEHVTRSFAWERAHEQSHIVPMRSYVEACSHWTRERWITLSAIHFVRFCHQLPVPSARPNSCSNAELGRTGGVLSERGSAMASASAAAVAAVSSGVRVCDASSRVSTSTVSLKGSLGHVRCLPRALSLNESVREVRFLSPYRRFFAVALFSMFLL
jgi:hypothetical protein